MKVKEGRQMRILNCPGAILMVLFPVGMILLLIGPDAGWGKVKTKIYLKRSATVEKDYVKLEEIANFKGDEEFIQRLKEIKIAPSPRPGSSRVINVDYIWVRLYQNGISRKEVSFEGEREVKIISRFRCIKGKEIADLAKKEILSLLEGEDVEVKVEIERIPSSLMIPFGKVKLKVDVPLPFHPRPSMVIPVKVYMDGKIYQTIPLTLKINIFKQVLVSSRRIAPDHIFEEKDVRREKREIGSLSGEPVFSLSDILGKRALRAIPPHTIIERDMIGPPLLVRDGDLVTIIKEEGNVEVSAKGKALEKGERGALIKVLNIDSQKKLQARIIGPRLVKID